MIEVAEVVGPYRLLRRLEVFPEWEEWLALDEGDALVRVERRFPLPGHNYTWAWTTAVRAHAGGEHIVPTLRALRIDVERVARVTAAPRGVTLDKIARALRNRRGALPVGVVLTLGLDVARAFAQLQALGSRGHALLLCHNRLGADGFEVGFDGTLRYRPWLYLPPDQRGGGPDAPMRQALEWLAPEEARGETRTPSTDVWHAGVALYVLATGQLPFQDDSVVRSLERLVAVDLRPPPDAPDLLRTLFRDCLRRDPRTRFATPAELARVLEEQIERAAPTTREDVARCLAALFPDELADHEQLREEIAAAPPVPRDDVPRAELLPFEPDVEAAFHTVLTRYRSVALEAWQREVSR